MTFIQAVKALELKDPFTKEPVSASALMAVLKDDVVSAVERPDSWQGSNMRDVLRCHGYLKDY